VAGEIIGDGRLMDAQGAASREFLLVQRPQISAGSLARAGRGLDPDARAAAGLRLPGSILTKYLGFGADFIQPLRIRDIFGEYTRQGRCGVAVAGIRTRTW
jgi:hypothetical protein